MIEGQATGDTTATIVAGDRKARKPELLHDRHHVLCHRALRIWRMVGGRGGTSALSVAAKIGTDNREVASEQRRNTAPHQMCLRKAVQQEDRSTGTAMSHENSGVAV